jgi:hypothetical protein
MTEAGLGTARRRRKHRWNKTRRRDHGPGAKPRGKHIEDQAGQRIEKHGAQPQGNIKTKPKEGTPKAAAPQEEPEGAQPLTRTTIREPRRTPGRAPDRPPQANPQVEQGTRRKNSSARGAAPEKHEAKREGRQVTQEQANAPAQRDKGHSPDAQRDKGHSPDAQRPGIQNGNQDGRRGGERDGVRSTQVERSGTGKQVVRRRGQRGGGQDGPRAARTRNAVEHDKQAARHKAGGKDNIRRSARSARGSGRRPGNTKKKHSVENRSMGRTVNESGDTKGEGRSPESS